MKLTPQQKNETAAAAMRLLLDFQKEHQSHLDRMLNQVNLYPLPLAILRDPPGETEMTAKTRMILKHGLIEAEREKLKEVTRVIALLKRI